MRPLIDPPLDESRPPMDGIHDELQAAFTPQQWAAFEAWLRRPPDGTLWSGHPIRKPPAEGR